MNISRLDQAKYSNAYGILCSPLPGRNARESLYPTFCRVPTRGRTSAHAHFEPELFFIVSGTGRIQIQDEHETVGAGDLVRIPPFARHELENLGSEELVFLSVYGEDFEVPLLPAANIVTAAPPTPNGPLHLGHISGPYLASDILARYLRIRRSAVLTHSATDDHQNYVAARARRLGEEPEAFRRRMRARVLSGLGASGIHYDEFLEPKTDDAYRSRVEGFTRRALDAGVITRQTVPMPYCADCETTLIDALIDARCPACGEASSGGCESCGLVVPALELLDPTCAQCEKPATTRPTEVHLFDLGRHLPLVQDDLDKLPLTPRLRALVRQAAARPKLEVLVTHPASDDAALVLPGTDQALHVWFEMAAHYERFALSAETWTHCFGFDNAFHYLLFIPALLRAMEPRCKLPDHVFTNEFLLLDGRKFSTSRGHAIWADELDGNADHLRLYLCLQRPDKKQTNFSLSDFRSFSAALAPQLEALRAHVGAATLVAEPSAEALTDCNRFTREMELVLSPQAFDLRRAARLVLDFLDRAVQDTQADVAGHKLKTRALAAAMEPIMPNEATSLRRSFGAAGAAETGAWISDWAVAL